MKKQHLGMWLSGGLGHVRLMVGLNDLKGSFQPKQYHDSSYYNESCLRVDSKVRLSLSILARTLNSTGFELKSLKLNDDKTRPNTYLSNFIPWRYFSLFFLISVLFSTFYNLTDTTDILWFGTF